MTITLPEAFLLVLENEIYHKRKLHGIYLVCIIVCYSLIVSYIVVTVCFL